MADNWKRVLSRVRAAVQQYDMIPAGDRVAVGVSGGKDSLVLLAALARLRAFYPVPFDLTALTLDPCFGGEEADFSPVQALCDRLEVPYTVRRTRLYEVVFEQRQESNPCSLCARLRRGALHGACGEIGCNVLALGHHQDDAAETFLMNLLDGGRVACFSPVTHLERRDLTVIRPLIYTEEKEITRLARREALPVVASRCPLDGHSHREEIKTLLHDLSRDYGPLTDKIVGAMQKDGVGGWDEFAPRK